MLPAGAPVLPAANPYPSRAPSSPPGAPGLTAAQTGRAANSVAAKTVARTIPAFTPGLARQTGHAYPRPKQVGTGPDGSSGASQLSVSPVEQARARSLRSCNLLWRPSLPPSSSIASARHESFRAGRTPAAAWRGRARALPGWRRRLQSANVRASRTPMRRRPRTSSEDPSAQATEA